MVQRTLIKLLNEAAGMIPILTEQEHGEILRLTSVLLLGYLLPYSTGNESSLLVNAQQQQQHNNNNNSNATFDIADYVVHMDLEERLNQSSFYFASADGGGAQQSDGLTDPSVELALDCFLVHGLAPLLAAAGTSRPVLTGTSSIEPNVDLIHVLAMAIHPHPPRELLLQSSSSPSEEEHDDSNANIPDSSSSLVGSSSSSGSRTRRLMENCLAAQQFQIHHGHRVRVIQILVQHLVFPELEDCGSNSVNNINEIVVPSTVLQESCVAHMRACLRAFLLETAMTQYDAVLAHSALVQIALQTNVFSFIKQEWDFILNRMVEDRTDYAACTSRSKTTTKRTTTTNQNEKEQTGGGGGEEPSDCSSSSCCCQCYAGPAQVMDPKLHASLWTCGSSSLEQQQQQEAFSSSSWMMRYREPICPHSARGQLLACCIVRYCGRGSTTTRRSNTPDRKTTSRKGGGSKTNNNRVRTFLHHALTSLTEVMEWQVDCWTAPPPTTSDGGDDGNNDKAEPNNDDDDHRERRSKLSSPCMLASLLFAAKHLFYFASQLDHDYNSGGDESEMTILLHCSIQLLNHSNTGIVQKAADLLIVAMTYGNYCAPNTLDVVRGGKQQQQVVQQQQLQRVLQDDSAAMLLQVIKSLILQRNSKRRHYVNPQVNRRIQKVIAIASRQSDSFAAGLFSFLMEMAAVATAEFYDQDADAVSARVVFSWIAAVASNCPAVLISSEDTDATNGADDNDDAGGVVGDVRVSMLSTHAKQQQQKPLSAAVCLHLVATLLARRQTHYFNEQDDHNNNSGGSKAIRQVMRSNAVTLWDVYRMARHALVTGNFGHAEEFYGRMLQSLHREKHYLWISALHKISRAETLLSARAAKGIPSATTELRSALSYLQSLDAMALRRRRLRYCCSTKMDSNAAEEGYAFQIQFVLLRIDFLDLVAVLRQATREMRLTGSGPGRHTRAWYHLQNTRKCLAALACGRYAQLKRRYGNLLASTSSLYALDALQGLALFLARAARAAFPDALLSKEQEKALTTTTVTQQQQHAARRRSDPMTMFLRRMTELVVQPMESTGTSNVLDPLVRAAAMLEVLDGILMVPAPFPRDFLVPRPTITATLLLWADPEQIAEFEQQKQQPDTATAATPLSTIEACPALCFTFFAAGRIPQEYLMQVQVPTAMILLWYRLEYEGPLATAEEDAVEEEAGGAGGPSSGGGGGGGGAAAVADSATAAAAGDDAEASSIRARIPDTAASSPIGSRLLADGRFYFSVLCPPVQDEGLFTIKTVLGCRDVTGREWEIPVVGGTPNDDGGSSRKTACSIAVRVSRSR